MGKHERINSSSLRIVIAASALMFLAMAGSLHPSPAQADTPGTWSATGALNAARSNYALVVLPNGKALIAGGLVGGTISGGIRSGYTVLGSAEVYDPLGGAFTTTGSMVTARAMCGQITCSGDVVLLGNGKVLIAGGINAAGTRIAAAELYDPVIGTFTATGAMTTAREGHTMTLLPSGKVLVAGGSGPSGALVTVELYDPSTGTFTAAATAMPSARDHHTATLLPNGKVLLAGGCSATSCGLSELGNAILYDPVLGTFSSAIAMVNPRAAHTATLLPTGKILLAGGVNPTGGSLALAELFDPTAGTFTATGNLVVARADHTATLVSNGKVLIATGVGSSGALNSAELYDPASGTFAATGTMVSFRANYNRATILPNGKVLVAGGTNPSGTSPNDLIAAELYCPDLAATPRTWALTASLGTARLLHSATLLPNGFVLIAGGTDDASSPTAVFASTEVYNPTTGTFSAANSMTTGRFDHTATLLANGKVLLAGGSNGSGSLTSSELYDPSTGNFTAAGTMNQKRLGHTATVLPNGKVLMAGGFDNTVGDLASAELYDPQLNSFTTTGSMATPRLRSIAVLLPDGKVLIAGGRNGLTINASAELYDPATGTFSTTGSMSTGRFAFAATRLSDGQILVAGGVDGTNTTLASAELYSPTSGNFSATGSMGKARVVLTGVLLPNGKALMIGGNFASPFFADVYDASLGTFSASGPMAIAGERTQHTTTLLPSGKVLITGGRFFTTAAIATSELYSTTICGPEIISISPTSGPIGTDVTILGANDFGSSQGTTTVTFNGVDAGSATSWDNCCITIPVPPGATTGPVVVTQNGFASNGVLFTVTSPPSFTLTVGITGNGSVTSNPTGISCPGTCSASFTSGQSVALTATAVTGSTFTGWSGPCTVGPANVCTVTMDAAKSVTATFAQTFTLTVTLTGSGSGTVTGSSISCPGTCTQNYVSGTSVVLTAAPAGSSTFTGWSGDCTGSGTCSLTMNANKNVSATFASATGNQPPTLATISTQTVNEGQALSFTVNASDVDGNTLTLFADLSDVPGATFTQTSSSPGAATGQFAWTPNSSQAGTKFLTFQVSDGQTVTAQQASIIVNETQADSDGDGVPDSTDNCPTRYNPDQSDLDGDGIGDVCESNPQNVMETTGAGQVSAQAAASTPSSGSITVTATITFHPIDFTHDNVADDYFVVAPSPYNIIVQVKDNATNQIVEANQIPEAGPISIPQSLVLVHATQQDTLFTVAINLNDWYSNGLPPGNYTITATYTNAFKDPDLGPHGECGPGCNNRIWLGSAPAANTTVTQKSATAQIDDLIAKINGLTGVSTKLKNDLIGKLTDAKAKLSQNKIADACIKLNDFIAAVTKEQGKGLTVAQANSLLADAAGIKATIGCP